MINTMIKDLENIMTYTVKGNLNKKIKSKGGLITLYELNQDIANMRFLRCSLLNKFNKDVSETFKKYDSKDETKLNFNPKKLLLENNLKFKLVTKHDEFNFLVSKNKIEKYDYYNQVLDKKISQIYKYIEGLFRVLENFETSNLLSNSFYEHIYLNIYNYMEIFKINGDGIFLSFFDKELNKISSLEKKEAIAYFYDNYSRILFNIFVENDYILDRYRINDNKTKALSLYKGGENNV